jgi:hypothetical protein
LGTVTELTVKNKLNAIFAWTFFGLIAASVAAAVVYREFMLPAGDRLAPSDLLFPMVPVVFSFVGALIISRQPRNVIGLLMMLPGVSMFLITDAYLAPYINGQIPLPASSGPLFLLMLWFSNWNWLLLVLPVVFIMALFPTGRPLSRRWSWLVYFGVGIVLIFILMITFAEILVPGSDSATWSIPNPIGFLKQEWINAITGPLLILFPIWIFLCIVSLFVRFRRAQFLEREQIKWLFYAGAIFVLFYMPSFIGNTYSQAESFWNLLLPIGMLAFPAAIAIAILRYRLYDIDVIIRRTIQYLLLTGLLVLVYFASVVLLQSLVEKMTGRQSPIVIVISTLGIAALFNPFRRRIQDFIDQRFYRKKYDAQKALDAFAQSARDETDLDTLTTELVGLVKDTMQPEAVSLWLKPHVRR